MEMCKVCRDFFEEENVKIKNGCCDNCNDFNIQEKKDNKTNVNIKETNKNNEEFNIWYYILSIALITVFINLFKQNKIEVEYIFYFVGIIIFMSFIYMVKKWLTIILILATAVCSIWGIMYYPLQIIAILLFILVITYFIKN